MRKDVKRSLILWPTVATTFVALMAGYTIVRDISHCIGPDTESLARATQPSFEIATASVTDIKISSRGEHGRRAMALPQRVADVLGVASRQSAGAVIVESPSTDPSESVVKTRIAGMILPPWGVVIDTSPEIQPVIVVTPLVSNADVESDPSTVLDGIMELDPIGSAMPRSNRALARPEFNGRESNSVGAEPQVELAAPGLATRIAVTEKRKQPSVVASWPATTLLDGQLESLATLNAVDGSSHHGQLVSDSRAFETASTWSAAVAATLKQLQDLPRLGHEDAEALINTLDRLANEGTAQAEKVSDRILQMHWLRASHGISRRVAIWKPVWQLANANAAAKHRTRFAIAMKPEKSNSVHAAIDQVRRLLPESGDAAGWNRYLLLNQISAVADSDDQQERMAVAKRFVARIQRRGLHPLHQQWLTHESIESLQTTIQPWARGVVDYADLLSHLERQETTTVDMAASKVAEAMQRLRCVDHPTAVRVANSIDTHYRNANMRVAITEAMLQRLVPEIPTQSIPISARVSGSRVRGVSKIDSDLQVSLIASADRWSLKLSTIGRVRTRTTGVRGPVSVRTTGQSSFTASTPIEITPYGIDVRDSVATVRGRTQLSGVETDYDGWPIVGSLVRGAVARRFTAMSAESSHVSNRKIAAAIEAKVDDRFNQQVGEATERLGNAVLGPLARLNLDPMVTDMQTTESRLVARYRLAGDYQLAAFTPRPRALQDSLLSVQIHESAINNALERLVPTESPMPIRDAISDAMNTFGDHGVSVPDDVPLDVTVQFARSRPITAEFKDDTLWVTLRVVRLRRGDRLNLTKFIVRAAYRPQMNGIHARLVRDGHLRISGPGMSMRERLPIRAIFNKILSSNRPLPLTLPAMTEHPALNGLVVGKLDLRDGWIAMSITRPPENRVASVESQVE